MWTKLKCWLGLCPFKPNSDDQACWGECVDCGKRVGVTSRKDIRAYIEREEAMSTLPSKLNLVFHGRVYNPSAPNKYVLMYMVNDERGVTRFTVAVNDDENSDQVVKEIRERLNNG